MVVNAKLSLEIKVGLKSKSFSRTKWHGHKCVSPSEVLFVLPSCGKCILELPGSQLAVRWSERLFYR